MATEADEFVAEYEGLVRKIAFRCRAEMDLKVDIDDLIGFGYEGLLEARTRFDDTRGVQFNTFAYYRIRGAVLDGVRKMAHLPRRVHQARKAAEAFDAMAETTGETRAQTPEQRADAAATLAAMEDILLKTSASFMLAAVGQDDNDVPESPLDALIGATEQLRVRELLSVLPEREAIVIQGFYFDGRNLDDIAAELGISKSWTSRIHTKALGILRGAIEASQ